MSVGEGVVVMVVVVAVVVVVVVVVLFCEKVKGWGRCRCWDSSNGVLGGNGVSVSESGSESESESESASELLPELLGDVVMEDVVQGDDEKLSVSESRDSSLILVFNGGRTSVDRHTPSVTPPSIAS